MHKFLLLFFLTLLISTLVQAQTINFGATLSLTGGAADLGIACQNGIELAVNEINLNGGIKDQKLKIVYEDIGDVDLKRAALAAQGFINIHHAKALLPNWSEDAEILGPMAEKAKIIAMTLGAGGPRAARFSSNLFRATTSDGELAKFAVKQERERGSKNACVFLADTRYYLDVGEDFVQEWNLTGGPQPFIQTIPYGSTDIRTLVAKLRDKDCSSVFIWASPATDLALLRELKNQSINANGILPWFIEEGMAKEIFNDAKNHLFLYRYRLSASDFADRYTERYSKAPMRPAANCYDGVKLLSLAMNSVGTEMDKVSAFLFNLKDYQGASGPINFQQDRERTGELIEEIQIK